MTWFRELNEKVVKDEVRLMTALRTKTIVTAMKK